MTTKQLNARLAAAAGEPMSATFQRVNYRWVWNDEAVRHDMEHGRSFSAHPDREDAPLGVYGTIWSLGEEEWTVCHAADGVQATEEGKSWDLEGAVAWMQRLELEPEAV